MTRWFAALVLALLPAAALAQTADNAAPPAPAPSADLPVPPPEQAATEDPGDGRIVGGEEAFAGTAPWQVQLYSTYQYTGRETAEDCQPGGTKCTHLALMEPWEKVHRCGGVYVGDSFVLTAAHCVSGVPDFGKARRVQIGTQNLKQPAANFRIADWRVHKDFVNAEPFPNDIAILRIEADNPAARRFKLKAAQIRMLGSGPGDVPLGPGDVFRITGWGRTQPRAEGAGAFAAGKFNHMSAKLLQINQVPGDDACAARPGYRDRIASKTICAVSGRPGVDSCNGDSGGPMTRDQGRERVLVGLVSWGRGCAVKNMPAIYTSVPGYLDWIGQAKVALATPRARR